MRLLLLQSRRSTYSPMESAPLKPFETKIEVKFRHGDAAGIMYFAHIFSFAHDVFEEFIVNCGFTWSEWFASKQYLVPIRHTACDYLSPFKAGQTYHVQASVQKISESSFTMLYEFSLDSKPCARVSMTHVYVDPQTGQKIPIPREHHRKIEKYAATLPGESGE